MSEPFMPPTRSAEPIRSEQAFMPAICAQLMRDLNINPWTPMERYRAYGELRDLKIDINSDNPLKRGLRAINSVVDSICTLLFPGWDDLSEAIDDVVKPLKLSEIRKTWLPEVTDRYGQDNIIRSEN